MPSLVKHRQHTPPVGAAVGGGRAATRHTADQLERVMARVELLEAALIELSEETHHRSAFAPGSGQDLDSEQYAFPSRAPRALLGRRVSLIARERKPSNLAPELGGAEVVKLDEGQRE